MEEEIKNLFKNAKADKWTCSHKVQRYCRECKTCRDPLFEPYPICEGIENCTKDYKDIVFNRYFSEEMQLRVLKVLLRGRWIEFAQHFHNKYYMGKVDFKQHFEAETFEEALAGLINLMWKGLPERDRNEIKKILGGEK